MLTVEDIDHLEKMLRVLQANGVRSCKIGEMAFELGNIYKPSVGAYVQPASGDSPEETLRRQQKELEELMFASAGG